ncbi:transglutaminase domain-containing protein [Butyrivibrio sp. NC3005]|uniref:transglutaminase domain-containing protein n=1 Tax=Butyrivibrio sp. NC3005 TaxID=1280685 RepID=UPI0003F88577|nr:transglutaminase domain-containing protein [Butyrivibrio sp. NC3005]
MIRKRIFRKIALGIGITLFSSFLTTIPAQAGEYILFENYEAFGYMSYADRNPDLKSAFGYNKDALWNHYASSGCLEGRIATVDKPSILTVKNFDAARYATDNPDVAAAVGTSPKALLHHYKTAGYLEGRRVFSTDRRIQGVLDVCDIAASITNSSMSDREKVKAVHDWMCLNLSYDNSLKYYSYLDAVNKKTAVCQGYAEMFDLFMHILGIEDRIATGSASNGVRSGSHAWNEVEIEGKLYAIDVTWDDTGEIGIPLRYTYFLISPQQMNIDHTEDDYYWIYKNIYIH